MMYMEKAQIISENIKRIREKIAEAAVRSGRNPADIVLVAACKQNGADSVKAAMLSGVDAAGENRVQEFMLKSAEGAYLGKPVHMIGHLQTNKVRQVAGKVAMIESVDSVRLAGEISIRALEAGAVQDILLEVNIAGEESKWGFPPEDIGGALTRIADFEGIRIRGLMSVPPKPGENGENRAGFRLLHQLFVDIKNKKYDNVFMEFLSMGMSGDYEDAILEGSNMVRIGTGIFGERI